VNFERWSELNRLYSLRPVRERLILVLAMLFGLAFIWNDYLQAGLVRQAASDPKRLERMKQDNVNLKTQYRGLVIQAEADPNALLRKSIERLLTQNNRLDGEIQNSSGRLVDPTKMVAILSRVLAKQEEVQLLSMSNLPSEKLMISSMVAASSNAPQIYKHGLSFEVKGRYQSIVEYLKALESSNAGFYWEDAHFSVEEYPYARLSVKVFTLSTQEQFLDV